MADRREMTKAKTAVDLTLLAMILLLMSLGLGILYSVSAYESRLVFDDPFYYLKHQGLAAALGIAGMYVISKIPYSFWERMSRLVYIVSLLLCAAVIFVGTGANGSRRWLGIGSFSIQPSELAKIAVIIYMAALLSKENCEVRGLGSILKVLLRVVPLLGVIAYSNLSTAVIVAGICVLMLFVVSKSYAPFFALGGIGAAAIAAGTFMASYRSSRIKAWLHPELYPDEAYQTLQGLYAIGSGGLFGNGIGSSLQKMGYVPEAQNDFIFSIICEEVGLVGALGIMLLFALFLWRFMVIANRAQDLFGSLLAVGVMSHISLQVVLNLAVVTNSIPNTGITLPFISYGGTSIAILLSEMGLVLSVSRLAKGRDF